MYGIRTALVALAVATGAGALPPATTVDVYTTRWVVPVSAEKGLVDYGRPFPDCTYVGDHPSECEVQVDSSVGFRVEGAYGVSGDLVAAALGVPVSGSVAVSIGCRGSSPTGGVRATPYPVVTRHRYRVVEERGDVVRARRPDAFSWPPYGGIGYDSVSPVASVDIPEDYLACVISSP